MYNSSYENTMNDPYQVQKVILKDNYNHMISGYSFEYLLGVKRGLVKLKKLDRNSAVTETTEFQYGTVSASPPALGYGISLEALCPIYTNYNALPQNTFILQKVFTPSGGVIEYNFEPNKVYYNKADLGYLNPIINGDNYLDPEVQFLDSVADVIYDTKQAIDYTFTISGTQPRKIFIAFGADEYYTPPLYWDTNTPAEVNYLIDGVYGASCGAGTFTREFYLNPGTHTLRITGSGGRGLANILYLSHLPLPLSNIATGRGVRISSIKYYNSPTEMTPVNTTKFDYDNFADANSASGYYFSSELDENAEAFILYKNVKVTENDGSNGYTKYYYKTPDDYPKNGNYWPYYAYTSGGLLDKREVYNKQNKILVSEQSNYTFEEMPGAQDYYLWGNMGSTSKLAWLKKSAITSTSFFDNNQSIEQASETNFNIFNFEIASTKKIADGNTLEQFYTYPESGYPQLSNAHIMSIPVKMEEKNDGKTVSKAETKYDNTNSVLPTSVLTFNVSNNANNTSKIAKKIDLYDSVGNVLQMSSDAGVPSTIVYGYNQTLPIARITGITYAEISSFVQPIIDASNADAQNPANEGSLLTALEQFRKNAALVNAQVTTYTYDPLIGVTTTTSPDGNRVNYKYNTKNQLEKIVNMDGATLKEYKYNYKN